MVRTTIMLPPALKARAERRARARGSSLGELIRLALEATLAEVPAQDPLYADDTTFHGRAPRDLAAMHDEHLYGDDG